jgi:hypothetical protein
VGPLRGFGTPGLRRFEYKGCVGEPKEIDPENSLSLSLSNIKYNIWNFINLGTISKKV